MKKQKTKSIGDKLKSVRSYQTQEKTLLDWSANWQDDQIDVINKLRYATQHDNYGDMMRLISQLEGLTKKRFTALNNVIKRVSDPNRVLTDAKSVEYSEVAGKKSILNLYTPHTSCMYNDPMHQDNRHPKTLAELNRQTKKDPSS